MQDRLIPLAREVERLVTAPYVPSLQDLYGIIQKTPFAVVCSWASCKPCQVASLVDVLVEGLSYSDTALELIAAFAPVAAFRNALLERYPAILDQLLQRAVGDEEESTRYLSTCTALLSCPLPADFTPPVRLAGFIMKLVHYMAVSPSAETIRPLYKLMTGLQTSPRILYEIPSDTMSIFQGELLKTLRNMDDHMGNLLCLGTFARIASSQKLNYEFEHGPQPPIWLQNVRHFFGPKRGLKTLDLVVLRVILACSASCNNLKAGEAAESVRLAIDICDTVEPEQKQVWITGNSSKIAKLCEKVTREGIYFDVQMMGVIFLATLLPVNAPSPNIPHIGLQGLLLEESDRVLETVPLELVPRLVEASAVVSGKPAIYELLNYAFSALKPHSQSEGRSMATTKIAASILSSFQIPNSHSSTPTVAEVCLALGRESMSELIESFPRQPRQPQCDQSSTCHAAVSTAENNLLADLFDLYSRSSVLQNINGENKFQTETSVISKFTAQVKKGICESKCGFAAAKPFDVRGSFSYLNIHEVSSNPRRNWRADISETIMSDARATHDGLMRKVEEACRDLEYRCHDTETPLRVIEEERDRAIFEAEQLRRRNSELEDQVQQAFNTITDLQQNTFNLEDHAEAATARVEELSAGLDAARKELEDQRRSFDESTQSERENARTKELDFMATLTERDDQLEELQTENHEQRAENEELRRTLDSVSKENGATIENASSMRKEISRVEGLLETSQQLTVERDDEIARLLAEKEQMGLETEDIRKKLENEASESNRLRDTLHDAEEHFAAETDALKKQNEEQILQANTENDKQREENKALQESMHVAVSNAATELQTKDKRIRQLERKIQSLRDERASKAREFSVAQEHIGRLMNVMGFKPDDAENKASSKHQRSRSTIGPSQAPPMQLTTNPGDDETQTQTQTDNLFNESFGLDTPNPNSGRSPKRPRGNSLSLDMTPAPPRNCSHDLTTKVLPSRSRTSTSTLRRERRPLEDADQNPQAPSPQSPAPSQSQNDFPENQIGDNANRNKLQEIDLDMDVEFTKDFLFTSTSLSGADDHASP